MIASAVRAAVSQGKRRHSRPKRGKEAIEVTELDKAAAIAATRNVARDRARRLGMIVREDGGDNGKR